MIDKTQCTGISFGLERLCALAKLEKESSKNIVISLNQDKEAIKLAENLRKTGKLVGVYYGKPSKALEYANAYGFDYAIFVGKKEVKKGEYKIKNLKTGGQSNLEF